jgi:GTP cyclohydrolase I
MQCTLCGKLTDEGFLVFKDGDSDAHPDIGICHKCRDLLHTELKYADQGGLCGIQEVVSGYKSILSGLSKLYGIDPQDDNFKDTPYRCARLMMEMNVGNNLEAAKDILVSASFPTEYKHLIASNNIRVSGLCPHHLVVVDYVVHVAYVPASRCVGLSKLPRVVQMLAKSMILQEDLTQRIINIINETLQPQGAAVMVSGNHNCISARGLEMKDVSNVTSAISGIFMSNPHLKEEWLNLVKLDKM